VIDPPVFIEAVAVQHKLFSN